MVPIAGVYSDSLLKIHGSLARLLVSQLLHIWKRNSEQRAVRTRTVAVTGLTQDPELGFPR